jgi:hypothetical protein
MLSLPLDIAYEIALNLNINFKEHKYALIRFVQKKLRGLKEMIDSKI